MSFSQLVISLILLMSVSMFSSNCMADSGKDKEECTEQLTGLATCLPYVGGDSKSPTPDCCNGLKQLLKTNKKCLCVIIKDRNDPDLGLKINLTLALGLPSVCHAPANVSQCPVLLKMDPNSPEAQVFYQLSKGSNHTASATTPSSSTSGSESRSNNNNNAGKSSTGEEKSNGFCNTNKFSELKIILLMLVAYLLY